MGERGHAADDLLELDHDLGDLLERSLVDLAVADDPLVGFDLDQDHVVAPPRAARGPVDLVEFCGHRMGPDAGDLHGRRPSTGVKQGIIVPSSAALKTSATSWPIDRASKSQSTRLVIMRGPSASST